MHHVQVPGMQLRRDLGHVGLEDRLLGGGASEGGRKGEREGGRKERRSESNGKETQFNADSQRVQGANALAQCPRPGNSSLHI